MIYKELKKIGFGKKIHKEYILFYKYQKTRLFIIIQRKDKTHRILIIQNDKKFYSIFNEYIDGKLTINNINKLLNNETNV